MTLLFLSLLFASSALAQDAKLCSIKTVYVEGHGGTFRWFRENIEKYTWLKLEDVKRNADAIAEVGGVGSVAFPINFKMVRREPEEFLYEASVRAKFKMWGDTPGEELLKKLAKAANCK